MSKIGTLKELNVQPGDVVEYVETGHTSTVTRIENDRYYGDGPLSGCPYVEDGDFRIVSRAKPAETGPVRTVTRKEIQTGIYLDGALIVSDAGFGRLQFAICTTDPETFDKAMDMLRDIRDALEEQ